MVRNRWGLWISLGIGITTAAAVVLQSLQGNAEVGLYIVIAGGVMAGVAAGLQAAASLKERRSDLVLSQAKGPNPEQPSLGGTQKPHSLQRGVDGLQPGDPRSVGRRRRLGRRDTSAMGRGRYRLVRRLGSGGMGTVYLGVDSSDEFVAVKVVLPQYAKDREFRLRFAREVAAVSKVDSPYVAPLLDAAPGAEPPWMVTRYIPGRSLHTALGALGPWPSANIWLLALGVAEALRAIHQAGIVHRDLKPANIMLGPDGPRVIDFGIARALDETRLTMSMVHSPGTPAYMAPEQVAGREVTPATDVFALGVILAQTATGRHPFGAVSGDMGYRVVHAEPDLTGIDGPLLDLIRRCLDKEPDARPVPAEIAALARAQSREPMSQWLPAPVAAQTKTLIKTMIEARRRATLRLWPATVVAVTALMVALLGCAIQLRPELAPWAAARPSLPPVASLASSPSNSPSSSLSPASPDSGGTSQTASVGPQPGSNVGPQPVKTTVGPVPTTGGPPPTPAQFVSISPSSGSPTARFHISGQGPADSYINIIFTINGDEYAAGSQIPTDSTGSFVSAQEGPNYYLLNNTPGHEGEVYLNGYGYLALVPGTTYTLKFVEYAQKGGFYGSRTLTIT